MMEEMAYHKDLKHENELKWLIATLEKLEIQYSNLWTEIATRKQILLKLKRIRKKKTFIKFLCHVIVPLINEIILILFASFGNLFFSSEIVKMLILGSIYSCIFGNRLYSIWETLFEHNTKKKVGVYKNLKKELNDIWWMHKTYTIMLEQELTLINALSKEDLSNPKPAFIDLNTTKRIAEKEYLLKQKDSLESLKESMKEINLKRKLI